MKPTQATELLIQAAKLLYGEHWSGSLGDDLNVDPRTLQRFASGKFQMPDDHPMLRDLAVIIDDRVVELKRIRDRITSQKRKAPTPSPKATVAPTPPSRPSRATSRA